VGGQKRRNRRPHLIDWKGPVRGTPDCKEAGPARIRTGRFAPRPSRTTQAWRAPEVSRTPNGVPDQRDNFRPDEGQNNNSTCLPGVLIGSMAVYVGATMSSENERGRRRRGAGRKKLRARPRWRCCPFCGYNMGHVFPTLVCGCGKRSPCRPRHFSASNWLPAGTRNGKFLWPRFSAKNMRVFEMESWRGPMGPGPDARRERPPGVGFPGPQAF